jgi:hypothetical protein
MTAPRSTRPALAAAALAGALAWAGVCSAQDRVAEAKPIPPPEKLTFSLRAAYQYIFETDVDGGGDVQISRAGLAVGAETDLSRDIDLVTNLRYELSEYDFSGVSDLGPDPWDDIHTLSVDARFQVAMTNDVALWGGPVLLWARQDGADWNEALTGGGFLGMTFIINEDLTLGAGMGLVTQLDDSLRPFPIFVVKWKITEQLGLKSTPGPLGIAATGLELTWDLGEGWEIGMGGRYEFRRFRLDDVDSAPDGVGEETSFPMWLRLSYSVNDKFSLDVYGGATFNGHLRLEDFNGRKLAEADYDSAPTVAVVGSLRF